MVDTSTILEKFIEASNNTTSISKPTESILEDEEDEEVDAEEEEDEDENEEDEEESNTPNENFSNIEHFENSNKLFNQMNMKMVLKALLFSCLFYLLSHSDTRDVFMKSINIRKSQYLYLGTVLFFVGYLILNIIV